MNNVLAGKAERLQQVAFRHYRMAGFPYPPATAVDRWQGLFDVAEATVAIQAPQPALFAEYEVTTLELDGSGTSVANSFHKHIWDSHAVGMRSPVAAFADDVALRKAIRLAYETTGKITDTSLRNKLKIVNGTQMCSNFRPVAARAIYQRYYTGKAPYVLDPSAGYGGRLLGFIAAGLPGATYVGVDPSWKSFLANTAMAEFYGVKERAIMHCAAIEDIPPDLHGLKPGSFDMAFSSPPYFAKEIYGPEPNQSHARYPEYSQWLAGFMAPMLRTCWRYVRAGGVLALNVANIKVKEVTYPLQEDTIMMASAAGWQHAETLHMRFSGFGKGLDKFKVEPIYVFRKEE